MKRPKPPDVPVYSDGQPLVVFDGVCHFCSRSMAIVYAHEKQPIFFVPMQSQFGREIMSKHGLDPDDPSSFLFTFNGRVFTSSSGVFALAKFLKGWPRLIRVFWIVPRPLSDWAYGVFARNRYRWFGKSKTCMIPTPDMKSRLLDMPISSGAL